MKNEELTKWSRRSLLGEAITPASYATFCFGRGYHSGNVPPRGHHFVRPLAPAVHHHVDDVAAKQRERFLVSTIVGWRHVRHENARRTSDLLPSIPRPRIPESAGYYCRSLDLLSNPRNCLRHVRFVSLCLSFAEVALGPL